MKLNQVSILGASNGPFLFRGRSSARKELLKLSTKPAQYIWSPPFKCGYSSPVAGVGIVNQLCEKYKGKSEQKSSTSVQHWIIHRWARAKSPGWDFPGTWNKASAAPGSLHTYLNLLSLSNWIAPFQIIIGHLTKQHPIWISSALVTLLLAQRHPVLKIYFSLIEFSHGQTVIRTVFCPTVPWSSGCGKNWTKETGKSHLE